MNKFIIYYSKNTKYWLFVGKEITFLKIKKTLDETRVKGVIEFYDYGKNLKIDNSLDFIIFEYPSQIKIYLPTRTTEILKKSHCTNGIIGSPKDSK